MKILATRRVSQLAFFLLVLTFSSNAFSQWEQVGWPVYANLKSFASAGELCVAADYYHLWGSTDGGRSWKVSSRSKPMQIAEHAGKIYLVDINGLSVTTDGTHWQDVKGLGTLILPEQICFVGDTIFAYGQVNERSTDAGATWSPFSNFPTSQTPPNLSWTSHGILFAIYNEGIYRSIDRGESWTRDSVDGVPMKNVRVIETVAGDFAIANDIAIGGYRDGSWRSFFPTLSGRTEQVAFPLTIGTTMVGMGYEGVIRSDDSGSSWRQISQLDFHGTLSSLYSSNGVIYAFIWGAGGVYRSLDTGVTWEYVTAGLESGHVSALASMGSKLFAMNYEEPTSSTDDGKSWTPISDFTRQSGLTHQMLQFGRYMFSMGSYWLQRSGDSGRSWQTLPPISPYETPTGIVVSHGVLLLNDDQSGVYRSKDSGMTWQLCPFQRYGNSFCEAGSNAYLFIPGLTEGFRTSDAGLTWSPACTELNFNGIQNGYPVSMFTIGDTLFLALGSLYRSLDDGNSWQYFASLPHDVLSVSLSSNGLLVGGTSISRDNGRTWINVADNLPSYVTTLTIAGDFVFAGVDGLGLWQRPLSSISKAGIEPEKGASNSMLTSYPNPFHSSTTLTVNLTHTKQASIRIYDLLGRAETIADNTTLTKGTHEFSWKPRAPGVYHCVLTTSSGERSVVKLVSRNE